jgi:hydroxymethylpyrimidine kinase / phosphomethylpyrimidine kinase / thiamine-phosphate diphosphorylase
MKPVVCIIAASDSAGASGIVADISACHGLHTHPAPVLTANTAQNTKTVLSVNPLPIVALSDQIRAVQDDLAIAAYKIGLIGDAGQVDTIITALQQKPAFSVLDPVLGSSTGKTFGPGIEDMLRLIPHVNLLTPNIPEAELLTGIKINSPENMLAAARQLHALGPAVYLKGGHAGGKHAIDLLLYSGGQQFLVQPRGTFDFSRGTGCTFASALASFIALGENLQDASALANAYVAQGLAHGYGLNKTSGPIARLSWPDQFTYFPKVVDALNWLEIPPFADCGNTPLGLYPVVDSVAWLEKLLPLGIKTIQLRIKDMPSAELDTAIQQAAALGRQYNARLFINDYWQLAIKHRAYGVHLGQEDMADADLAAISRAGVRLGLSTHGDFEWARAASIHPSYLAIGAIYATQTKEVKIVGPRKLQRWVHLLKPYFALTAIGGINLSNITEVLRSGIDSVAVVSAITHAQDPARSVAELTTILTGDLY